MRFPVTVSHLSSIGLGLLVWLNELLATSLLIISSEIVCSVVLIDGSRIFIMCGVEVIFIEFKLLVMMVSFSPIGCLFWAACCLQAVISLYL